jgi:hypothetical protein
MLPELVDQWLARLQTVPARDQVACVLMAARRCEPIASRWFEAQKLGAAYRDYVSCLDRWLAGKASDRELEKAAHPLDRGLNREIENEPDLPGAMAAHSLLDTEAIALGFSPEMLDEILRAAVFFAAAAFTGSDNVPVEVDTDRLSPGELNFIQEWWQDCTRTFPALGS